MILAQIRMNCGEDREIATALRALCAMTATRLGCRSCELHRGIDHPDQLLLLQQWNDWPSLTAHIHSDVFAQLLQILELSVDRPSLQFCQMTGARGLEFVEAVRLGTTQEEEPAAIRK